MNRSRTAPLGVLLAIVLMALGSGVRAADCPSPEACLARAMEQNWAAFYDYIEAAGSTYREDRAFYEEARKLGRADLIALTEERLQASEPVWRHARAMGEAIAAPGLGAYLDNRVGWVQSQVELALERVAREQRLLDNYLRTSGPARETALRDMIGYAQEADRLMTTLAIDSGMTVAFGMAEVAATLSQAGKLSAYGEAARQLGEKALVAGHAVHAGIEGEHAIDHGDRLKACLEVAGAAGTLVNSAARVAGTHALHVVGAAEVYAGLLAVTLDTVLLLQNAVLIEEARQRNQELGLHEQRFGIRVLKAQVEARRLARLRDDARERVAQRQRIVALVERMPEQP